MDEEGVAPADGGGLLLLRLIGDSSSCGCCGWAVGGWGARGGASGGWVPCRPWRFGARGKGRGFCDGGKQIDFSAMEEKKGWACSPKREEEGERGCGLRERESNAWAEKGPTTER
uniref:Uncharacterized protein n=1 Tax=Oryza sativa subsp. japonica TaxID=39947 RepID=Q8S6Q2_ORYSJ|nr:hypothetical protein LOC_Os10g13890 [Oryza sativa Japonica Group]